MENRLFIISNRLPVTISESNIQQASGGLVSAISSYLHRSESTRFEKTFWAGVPGCSMGAWASASKKIDSSDFDYLPVFVNKKDYDGYYNGFSNSVIWPLFHYFPSYVDYSLKTFEAYRRVNHAFCEELGRHLRPHDTVWIHDYHLLPLAGLLRKNFPELTIGFFLHIPFPSYEIFRLMPKKWQTEILEGILGADLVGFHTLDYASHFMQSVLMVMGLDSERHQLNYDNRLIKIDVFPISIDYDKFNEGFDTPEVRSIRESLRAEMRDKKIIFSIDRLDYTKGVRNRLKAYEQFLADNPGFREKVVFILVIIPSRDNIPRYAERKKMIDEQISQINSSIGNIHWMPVIYQYNTVEFEHLLALYTACDLALITPLRDGMNLVSKEFVASRKDKRGVLILSEMAGAARELTDALTINPNDISEMAEKIGQALQMSEQDQETSLDNMQRRIASYNVKAWADDFMSALFAIKQKQKSFQIRFIDQYSMRDIVDAYRSAQERLLLLDYDGTLVPFQSSPEMAVPGGELLGLLQSLCETEGNDVYVISGRNSAWLERQFGHLPIHIIAEHGARYKAKNEPWVTEVSTSDEWKDQVQNIMDMYVRRCANSFIEKKEFSMVWHYRNANISQGKLRASELTADLHDYVRHRHLQVLPGNRIVEVRQSGINKGSVVRKILDKKSFDFVFAVGDDRTDEDMFRVLLDEKNVYSIKVGPEASYARYNLYTPSMVVSMLQALKHAGTRSLAT
jgi:trehalose 6-phosphate synthase/phosphatase